MEEPYLTPDEIATRLKVTAETVRGYITRQKDPLPAYKLGREYRVLQTDFDAWMKRRKTGKGIKEQEERDSQE